MADVPCALMADVQLCVLMAKELYELILCVGLREKDHSRAHTSLRKSFLYKKLSLKMTKYYFTKFRRWSARLDLEGETTREHIRLHGSLPC